MAQLTGNPAIDAILMRGQNPSQVGVGTPGINPGAAMPQVSPKQNILDKFLNKPGGSFLMNLLAQQGFSTTPHSPLGAIGKAGLMTQQQQAEREDRALNKKLVEARLKIGGQSQDPAAVREWQFFQTLPEKDKEKYLQLKRDTLSVQRINNVPTIVDEQNASQIPLSSVASEADSAATIAGSVEGAKQGAITGAVAPRAVARDEAERTVSAPQDIKAAETTIANVTDVRDEVNTMLDSVGITTGGPLGAVLQFVPGSSAKDFAATKEKVVSFLSLDKIAEMKAQSASGATGLGAVNEREFDALSKARANLDQATSPSQMRRELSKLLAILNRIEQAATADIERARSVGAQPGEGFRIVE